jgi:CheY-like chemotaxis protein
MDKSEIPPNNRILIIDDNAAIHRDIRKVLEGQSNQSSGMEETEELLFGEKAPKTETTVFEIDSAYQGQEGLEKVRQALEWERPYSMAFVDVRMPPGWDGVETVNAIWKVYPELQVVICTAYSDYSWSDLIGQVGKTSNLLILKKPFDNIEVLQMAHALTDKWLLAQQVKKRMKVLFKSYLK